ncbi:hypothetical protein [uncultured Acetatifactor sp.]|uniref:hypothetical protein n=1 Tax=uncultured Acetatifactor sp. TaxID=1671927 RepID=UPI0025CBC50E|nr:hypothetical protein [uncultured Acetatifactor sp.]MCI9232269.1 hypothetical protein [Lachnospiraceae bacterium]MCI9651189.1 hypothetical protein [Lachnospiraceae bacterium]
MEKIYLYASRVGASGNRIKGLLMNSPLLVREITIIFQNGNSIIRAIITKNATLQTSKILEPRECFTLVFGFAIFAFLSAMPGTS